LRYVDREAIEARLGAWAEGLLGEAPGSKRGEEAIAIDVKILRGRQKQSAPGAPLLSALAPRVGVTLAQQAVDPTFKGVWYAAVHFALLPLLDTRLDQCPRPHR
jgi:hypothetical protein